METYLFSFRSLGGREAATVGIPHISGLPDEKALVTPPLQTQYINKQVKEHQAAGEPVISVDAKKKEQIGLLPMAGQEWRPAGKPVEVEDHSFFAGPQVESVIPYGIYDMTANTGWVNVGTDHNTSA